MAYDTVAEPDALASLISGSPTSADARTLARGLPISAVEALAARVAPDEPGFKYRLVPKATFARRKAAGRPLTCEEGDRLVRLARVWAYAEHVFGADWKVRGFMRDPHWLMDDRPPMDLILESEIGAKVVEQDLFEALNGMPI